MDATGCDFFFFSSRRRHTRCSRDWSSDVCSSDLKPSTSSVRLTTVARTGRSTKMSVNFLILTPLLVLGSWRRIVRRLDGVVDDHRKSRTQLDLPCGDDGVAFLDPGKDRDLIAARLAGRDEPLLRDERDFLVLPFALFHHKHGVPVGIVGDRGLRQREETL